jgi:hypothetical protein
MYGSLADIKKLIQIYSKKEVKRVFLSFPKKIYTKPASIFIKEFILQIKGNKLDPKKYIKTLF